MGRTGPAKTLCRASGQDDWHEKTLVYITRAYDPKEKVEILAGTQGVDFRQLRWHDFYTFLQKVEIDALVEEVMLFMEEQRVASSYRFSTADLMALSVVPRAFEIFDETLGDEVKAELETFAGNKLRRENLWEVRVHQRYLISIPLHGWELFCHVGYQIRKVGKSAHGSILRIADEGYPAIFVLLEAQPRAVGRDVSLAAMQKIASNKSWETYNLDNPTG